MDIKKRFGFRLKKLRREAGISQETLANLAGIDRTYLPDIEKGNRNVSITIVEKLSKALKISIKEFFIDD